MTTRSCFCVTGMKNCLMIAVCTCGVARPAGWVWRAKRVPLRAIIGIFSQIPTKRASDTQCSVRITEILCHHNVTSFNNVMMSLMMSSPTHVQQVTWPLGIKGWGVGSVTQDLQEVGPLEACTGSDVSGVSLWLEPTAFNCIKRIHLCVIPPRVFKHVLKCSRKAQEYCPLLN